MILRRTDSFNLDAEDGAITRCVVVLLAVLVLLIGLCRSDLHFRALFAQAGLKVVHSELQIKYESCLSYVLTCVLCRMPKALLPIRMYALQPVPSPSSSATASAPTTTAAT